MNNDDRSLPSVFDAELHNMRPLNSLAARKSRTFLAKKLGNSLIHVMKLYIWKTIFLPIAARVKSMTDKSQGV